MLSVYFCVYQEIFPSLTCFLFQLCAILSSFYFKQSINKNKAIEKKKECNRIFLRKNIFLEDLFLCFQ